VRSIVIILIFVIGLTVPMNFFAQAPVIDEKRVQKSREVREKVGKFGTGREAVVKVRLYSDTEYRGYISRAGADDFEVTTVGGSTHSVRYDEVRSIGGKNMTTGKKIAIGLGIGAGITVLIFLIILNELGKNS
jgi:hypothetical protein